MNVRSETLSPVSAAGSEWSGISKYQSLNSDAPYSPRGGPLATPPISGSSTGTMSGGLPNGILGRNLEGNPSPPSSVTSSTFGHGRSQFRDSAQSQSAAGQRRREEMEQMLARHYVALKEELARPVEGESNNTKPNRAKDKLLRLSAVQFQELSTDVYDELVRRQHKELFERGGPRSPNQGPPGPPPPHLLPKERFHPKRNQARQKLSTLPPPRFRDLATDVFYELERRFPNFSGGNIDRISSPAPSMGPGSRRGTQGSMGPGRGPGPGFRGPPGGPPGSPGYPYPGPRKDSSGPPNGAPAASAGNEYGRPLPKTFQSNTIIPNKSTLVEDDDDQSGPDDDEGDEGSSFGLESAAQGSKRGTMPSEAQKQLISDNDELKAKCEELESRLKGKDEELEKLQESSRSSDTAQREWSDLQADLERKLTDAQNLNDSLEAELERVRTERSDLNKQLEGTRGNVDGDVWRQRYEDLQSEQEDLKVQLKEQEEVTEEVRQQASVFLREMKDLSARSSEPSQREASLVHQVTRMEDEVKEWKSRYARIKTQHGDLHSPTTGLAVQNVDQISHDTGFTQPDGLVKDIDVTQFQIAIDELLRNARTAEPSSVLDFMKPVAISVRQITQVVAVDGPADDSQRRQQKLKNRVSATANNLITASKNFATANGLSPISLLDAAASHLAAAVVELIREVKIRPSSAEELEDFEESSQHGGSVGYFTNGRTSSDSAYSGLSSPMGTRPKSHGQEWPRPPASRAVNGTAMNGQGSDSGVEELKRYTDDEMGNLVQSIRDLVDSVQAEEALQKIEMYISRVLPVLDDVVAKAEAAVNHTSSQTLRDGATPIVQKLANCRARFMDAYNECESIDEDADAAAAKDFRYELRSLAIEVARETRELADKVTKIAEAASLESFN
ncbi:MAG: hypothetical protein M1819_007068 [Sarea resinae]|nr:MAG: hypothetical protein M1819_007068 [Sarea resinae]